MTQAVRRSFEFAPACSREWRSASGRPVIELDEAVGIFRIVSHFHRNGRQLSIANAGVDARPRGRLQMFDEARKLWHEIYRDLSKEQSGLLGAIVARAEAQVIRLALVYAQHGLIEIVAARQARKRMVASL